jgi:hypothetical protein
MLVCAVVDPERTRFEAAHLLAFEGEPEGASFSLGDDLTYGEGDFGDYDKPAEFNETQNVTTGLWIVEWDWHMAKVNSGHAADDYEAAVYSKDRWSRPAMSDLESFGMLPVASEREERTA